MINASAICPRVPLLSIPASGNAMLKLNKVPPSTSDSSSDYTVLSCETSVFSIGFKQCECDPCVFLHVSEQLQVSPVT